MHPPHFIHEATITQSPTISYPGAYGELVAKPAFLGRLQSLGLYLELVEMNKGHFGGSVFNMALEISAGIRGFDLGYTAHKSSSWGLRALSSALLMLGLLTQAVKQ